MKENLIFVYPDGDKCSGQANDLSKQIMANISDVHCYLRNSYTKEDGSFSPDMFRGLMELRGAVVLILAFPGLEKSKDNVFVEPGIMAIIESVEQDLLVIPTIMSGANPDNLSLVLKVLAALDTTRDQWINSLRRALL